jgi:hypothetical protein
MNVVRSVEYLGAFVGAWAVAVVLLASISSPANLGVVGLGLTVIFDIGLFVLLTVVGLALYLLVNRIRQ